MNRLIIELGSISIETHGSPPGSEQDSTVIGGKTLNNVDKQD